MTYDIEFCGGACPTQAWGRTDDNRPFYFRARHGGWKLWLGDEGDDTNYTLWRSDGENIGAGEDPTSGYMERPDVEAILDRLLAGAVS